jgi:methylmalonyl-CoA mutase
MDDFISQKPSDSEKEWKQRIQYELNGIEYNNLHVKDNFEKIHTKPFYTNTDSLKILSNQKNEKKYLTVKSIHVKNELTANTLAKEILFNGVNVIKFRIENKNINLEQLYEGINSENIILDVFNTPICNSTSLQLYDPISYLMENGKFQSNYKTEFENLKLNFEERKSISINSVHLQNSGCNCTQQVAYSILIALEYLNSLKTKNLNKIIFSLAIGNNFNFELAKVKALKDLWEVLSKELNIKSSISIIAKPTDRNKTLFNLNTNDSNSTLSYKTSILSQVDFIEINLPNSHFKKETFKDLEQEITKIKKLKTETQPNPVSNSYYIENLSYQISKNALEIIQSVEKTGGILENLKKGIIQKKVKECAETEILLAPIPNEYSLKKINDLKFDTYPFLKKRNHKTIIEPIIAKRVYNDLELKKYD